MKIDYCGTSLKAVKTSVVRGIPAADNRILPQRLGLLRPVVSYCTLLELKVRSLNSTLEESHGHRCARVA